MLPPLHTWPLVGSRVYGSPVYWAGRDLGLIFNSDSFTWLSWMERLWTNSFRASTVRHSFPATPLWDTSKATAVQTSSKKRWQGWPWDHGSWSQRTLFTGSAKLAWDGVFQNKEAAWTWRLPSRSCTASWTHIDIPSGNNGCVPWYDLSVAALVYEFHPF